MPALNFQKRFAHLVESGEKCQTIRKHRKDGRATARVGDRLYLYTGMRTRGCRKIGEAVCTQTASIVIDDTHAVFLDHQIQTIPETTALAQRDGFAGFYSMMEWFEETHDMPFDGMLIEWRPAPSVTAPPPDEIHCVVCNEDMAVETDWATECGRDDCPHFKPSPNCDSQTIARKGP